MNYRDQRNYENLTKRTYPGVGTYGLSPKERKMLDRVKRTWYYHNSRE